MIYILPIFVDKTKPSKSGLTLKGRVLHKRSLTSIKNIIYVRRMLAFDATRPLKTRSKSLCNQKMSTGPPDNGDVNLLSLYA